jgi:hypothetical protein
MPPLVKPPTTEEIEQALKNGIAANPEIGDALKEFEVQSQQFEASRIPVKAIREGSAIVRFLIKYSGGAIKEEKQAEYVLLAFVIIALSTSLYLFFGGGEGRNIEELDPSVPAIFKKR